MSNIIGTTIDIERFLKNQETTIPFGAVGQAMHHLLQERKYIIPYYQREIRWEEQNLISLINDINAGHKFIGNVILSSLEDNLQYEIVDGQQRITSLLMILQYLRNNDVWRIEFESCEFSIQSFPGFAMLYEKSFNLTQLNCSEKEIVDSSDDYGQKDKYCRLFDLVKNYFLNKDRDELNRFYDNLKRSEINLIISTDTNDRGMGLFLDVNLKALPLEAEDIFKGYFFKNSRNIENAIESWTGLKKAYNKFKKNFERRNLSCKYDLIILLEHYIRSTLYAQNTAYANIDFDSEFRLRESYIHDAIGQGFAGDHLLEVIKDSDYMFRIINGATKYLQFITNIVENDAVNETFRNNFICTEGEINNNTMTIFFGEIKNIILGDHNIPRAFLLKYYISTIKGEPNNKESYKKLHVAFLLGILFAVLVAGERKQLKEFEPMLRSAEDEWHISAIEKIKNYFEQAEFTDKVLLTKLRVSKPEENHQHLAKAIAAIYNFYKIEDNVVKITNERQAKAFFGNNALFSVEHFLINKSGKIKIANENEIYIAKYPKEIARAKDSIFNFIFISEDMNKNLDCYTVNTKTERIGDIDNLVCEFTKMYLRKLQNLDDDKKPYFDDIVVDEDDAKSKVEEFYSDRFIQNYKEFVEGIFYEVKRRLIP